jgi:hypothetical protein
MTTQAMPMRNFFAMLFEGLPLPGMRRATAAPGPLDDRARQAVQDRVRSAVPTPLAAAEEHDERQQLAYWHLWRLIRPVDAAAMPPSILDPAVPEHVTLALTVVGDYDAAREQPGPAADSIYRSVSELPYPPASIRRCCELLIRIADGEAGSSSDDREMLEKEREALGLALFSLDFFVDGNPSGAHHRKNLANGERENVPEPTPTTRPTDGDVIIRSGLGETDYVSEVVGLGDDEEWIVLTITGASIQVVRNAASGQWEEVNVIDPAPARWLTLTPSGGTPSWDSEPPLA